MYLWFYNSIKSLSEVMISYNGCVVCLTIALASMGVGGWLGACVWVRAEEGIAERAGFLVGWMFDYVIASSLLLKWWWVPIVLSFVYFRNHESFLVCHCYPVTDDQVNLLVLNCRMSPRLKTERDVPDTAGTDGRRRRICLCSAARCQSG